MLEQDIALKVVKSDLETTAVAVARHRLGFRLCEISRETVSLGIVAPADQINRHGAVAVGLPVPQKSVASLGRKVDDLRRCSALLPLHDGLVDATIVAR